MASVLLDTVANTMERYGMIRPGQAVGVAVSGGADSVCLLHALVILSPRWDLRLHVLHLDHGLRGTESRADAEFVRGLAAGLSLPAIIERADLSATPDNLEEAGRRARMAFFRAAIDSGAVERVATGHTLSDQAETILFRFLRGSGTAGLAGIRPVTRDGLIRPLLEVTRADVEGFVRSRSLSWREDSTNSSQRFARNRIRHSLLPQLAREWNPAIGQTLAHMAAWAQEEETYWSDEVDRLSVGRILTRPGDVLLNVSTVADLPLAPMRRLIRRAMECAKGDLRAIGFAHVEQVLSLLRRRQGHGHVAIPGLDVIRSFDWLRFSRREATVVSEPYRLPVVVPGCLQIPSSRVQISLELIEKPETISPPDSVYNEGMGCLDWGRLSSPLELRNWAAGDRYQPAGSSEVEKIKTLFQRARIPLWDRRGWPVLWGGNSIVWARRFGAATQVAANSSSSSILRIRESEIG